MIAIGLIALHMIVAARCSGRRVHRRRTKCARCLCIKFSGKLMNARERAAECGEIHHDSFMLLTEIYAYTHRPRSHARTRTQAGAAMPVWNCCLLVFRASAHCPLLYFGACVTLSLFCWLFSNCTNQHQ